MKTTLAAVKARRAIMQRNALAGACSALILLAILLSVLALKKDRETVLVPTMLGDRMVINSSKVDRDYLDSVCRDALALIYNMSPGTTGYAKRALLALTAPDFYGEMNQALSDQEQDMSQRKYSTVFTVLELNSNTETLTCKAKGQFSTYLGNERVGTRERVFVVPFLNVAGRLWLKPIKEEVK